MNEYIIFICGIIIGYIFGYVFWLIRHEDDYEKGFDDAWNKHKDDAYAEFARELRQSILYGMIDK